MNQELKVFGIFVALVTMLMMATFMPPPLPATEADGMQRFESYEQLKAAFEAQQSKSRNFGVFDTMAAISMPASGAVAESESVGVEYSETNVQVEGVDEADIVKTDGKYIYSFSKNRFAITDAYPVEEGEVISVTSFEEFAPQEMFVEGDKALLFGRKTKQYPNDGEIGMEMMIAPAPCFGGYCGGWGSTSAIRLYDISDKSAPALEKEVEFEGSYLTSRLIGKKAYFVVNSWPVYAGFDENNGNIIPLIREDGVETRIADATEIGFIPPMPIQSFVTIASLDLSSKEMQRETIAGSAETIYASQQNIYLAAVNWNFPEIPIIGDVAEAIVGNTIETTVVNKFGLEEGKVLFAGQGSVPGHVLNQFSMDEFEGNFRIATTYGRLSRNGSETSNNIYVLDEEMEIIGSLEDLAPGESIYSARFMGKKAYLVTFKKVDPLFVIDMADAKNPKVLGKLKIPGYSDYLHPIDETHLIGIGKEAIEALKGDFAWYQGVKMAVFDVSDVENPVEMHKVVIGDRGTDSYALYDHRAFLFDKEKELLVVPVMLAEIPEEDKKPLDEEGWPAYGEPVFQGAFVYRLTLENGFEERARITHVSGEDELKRGYYYGDEYSVKRALYIGDVLYTHSDSMIKANSLDTMQSLKEFTFG